MIQYPHLKEQRSTRQVIDVFKGYNHNLRIGSGEFYEMENLTSDDYPVLSTRGKRSFVERLRYSCKGMFYVPERGLFYLEDIGGNSVLYLLSPDGVRTEVTRLNPNPKKFVLIGKQLVIAPEMRWVDVESLATGDLEEKWEVRSGTVTVQMCDADGRKHQNITVSPEPPSNPVYHQLWLCNAVGSVGLNQYEPSTSEWISMATYIEIAGLGEHNFQTGDAVEISGLIGSAAPLDGSFVIQYAGRGNIVVSGVIYENHTQECSQNTVTIERTVPKLDFVVEAGNRLWGCLKDTNEIYACKLGDIRNWHCFQGLSTDSWVGSIGTPGEFTGAIVQNGYPIFYKENCKHKIWPSATGAHQISTTPCDGVEKGSENSLAVLDGTVFYKSALGVFADAGGGAVEIGHCLGDVSYRNAAGAIYDRKKVKAYFSRADLFLFPSTFDTSGLVVKEAAACGCPSILTKGSCAAEDVEDGVSGILSNENSEEFTKHIVDYINSNDLQNKLKAGASEKLYRSWDSCVDLAVQRYYTVIENHKHAPRKKPNYKLL